MFSRMVGSMLFVVLLDFSIFRVNLFLEVMEKILTQDDFGQFITTKSKSMFLGLAARRIWS